MASRVKEKTIFNSFSFATKENWVEAAQSELNNADPFEKLSFHHNEIKILPYYDQTDVPPSFSFSNLTPSDPYLGARAWLNMPKINASDNLANVKALEALNNGADGILFEVTSDSVNAEKILKSIDLRYCTISFLIDSNKSSLLTDLKNALTLKAEPGKTCGAFFYRQYHQPDFDFHRDWNSFQTFGVVISESDPLKEITDAINRILQIADWGTDAGWDAEKIFQRISVMISINVDFFMTIAKLKALQIIWIEILKAYEVNQKISLNIHACSAPWIKNEYQPHGNMLKSTTAGLAAVLGGCSALTIEAENENHSMMARMARNVSTVLREESYLSKVSDPTAGSYYIDHLTYSIAEAAWKKIKQSNEA
jgi:methylmalonyl-CoA mutase